MKIAILTILVLLLAFSVSCSVSYAGVVDEAFSETKAKDGVREITYDRFMSIRSSGEKYVLLDVLSAESYASGHIPGAKSLPLQDMNVDAAAKVLNMTDPVVVYCGSFKCPASTKAAKALSGMGYKVLDYKGGLKEWQEKGEALEK
jgi:rhodanese-related sulfurtransferase